LTLQALIPSKTFLYGEYAVLHGGKSCVIAHKPSFSLEINLDKTSQGNPFHPESPAGQLLAKTQDLCGHQVIWADPHQGSGGFGGSTAEYLGTLLVKLELEKKSFELFAEWKKYRNQLKGQGSGADFVAQATGGLCEIQILASQEVKVNPMVWPFEDVLIYWWKTARKVKTYEDLRAQKYSDDQAQRLARRSEALAEALSGKKKDVFFQQLMEFYHELSQLGLQQSEVKEEVEAWMKIPGLLGAKGCGAQGADVFMIFVEKDKDLSVRQELINRKIEFYSLKDISEGVRICDSTN
jgi:mevalonate kinase